MADKKETNIIAVDFQEKKRIDFPVEKIISQAEKKPDEKINKITVTHEKSSLIGTKVRIDPMWATYWSNWIMADIRSGIGRHHLTYLDQARINAIPKGVPIRLIALMLSSGEDGESSSVGSKFSMAA